MQSPTRVDFSGGTLDCWPLFDFVGGARTVNLSIDIMTSVNLTRRADSRISALSMGEEFRFKSLEELLRSVDPKLDLLRNHLDYWKPRYGFDIELNSQSPVGGGLGGSSSLSVSLIKAFAGVEQKEMSEIAMVSLASNIEAKLLHTPTGTQDYFPAIRSGLRVIHYEMSGPTCEILDVELKDLKSRMFLVYTGRPHHSGLNNWQVIKRAVDKDAETLAGLHALKEVSEEVALNCKRQNWAGLADLFLQEYKHRLVLAPAFSSPEIERLNTICLQNGAQAVKICGAGGGGCVMVWSEPEEKFGLLELCANQGFQVFDVNPVGA